MQKNNSIEKYGITSNIKNIIFDLDGTFYPLRILNLNMFFASLKGLKRAKLFKKARVLVREINWDVPNYDNRNKFLSRQAASVNVDKNYFDKFYADMEHRFVKLKAFVGVNDTLFHLKESGFRLFVYSDFPIGNKLNELGISDFFDMALCSEDTGFLKPDTRGFQFFKDRTGIEAYETLFVGDSEEKDGGFAHNCGMAFSLIGRDWIWQEDQLL